MKMKQRAVSRADGMISSVFDILCVSNAVLPTPWNCYLTIEYKGVIPLVNKNNPSLQSCHPCHEIRSASGNGLDLCLNKELDLYQPEKCYGFVPA